ncbi:MAG: chloride channel protein [Sedimentisphaerales bacterium]|nr:chloride channel protein [Sedimentisphaerales bacterium]
MKRITFLNPETRASYVFLGKWILLALIAGPVGCVTTYTFGFCLNHITAFLARLAIGGFPVPLPLYAVAGAVIVGAVIYRLQPEAAGEGIPSYLRSLNRERARLPILVTLSKYLAVLVTLSTFGNGGVVGPLGRVGAGVMSWTADRLRKIGFKPADRRTAVICGMAAAVAAIFHSPIGAGVFAVEIIQRERMGYKDLFPSILSGITAVSVCRLLGIGPFYPVPMMTGSIDIALMAPMLLMAILTGIVGGGYTGLYSLVVRVFKRDQGNVLLKVVIGSAIAAIPAWLVNPLLMGTSDPMFAALFAGRPADLLPAIMVPYAVPALILMLVLKALFNCITVGSGMNAGFTGPSVLIGMLFGAAFALLLGIEPGSAGYFAFLAAGFSGMLASAMNVPLAAAIMAIELFGPGAILPAGLAAVIGFQVTRHTTIYDFALAGAGHPVE